jgi:hypothetical protein
MNSKIANEIPEIKVKKVEKAPYIVDRPRLRRFDSKNTIFNRVMWDSSWEGFRRMYDEEVPNIISEGKPGYSRVDFASAYAS